MRSNIAAKGRITFATGKGFPLPAPSRTWIRRDDLSGIKILKWPALLNVEGIGGRSEVDFVFVAGNEDNADRFDFDGRRAIQKRRFICGDSPQLHSSTRSTGTYSPRVDGIRSVAKPVVEFVLSQPVTGYYSTEQALARIERVKKAAAFRHRTRGRNSVGRVLASQANKALRGPFLKSLKNAEIRGF
jgi:hypothetical protein